MVDFTGFMAQKDQKNKLKQIYMKIIELFFGDNSEEKA
jgi:primosomal replication protein N